MKDTISESIEILVAKGNSFEDFDLVVTTLGKAICNRGRERIENAGHPVIVNQLEIRRDMSYNKKHE